MNDCFCGKLLVLVKDDITKYMRDASAPKLNLATETFKVHSLVLFS